MPNLVKHILKKIKYWDIGLVDQYQKDGVDVVCTEMIILACEDKTNTIRLLFHTSMKPDDSAQVILDLQTIKDLKNIYITDVFLYIDDLKNIVVGQDAIDLFEGNTERNITEKFMRKQEELQFLINCPKIGNC